MGLLSKMMDLIMGRGIPAPKVNTQGKRKVRTPAAHYKTKRRRQMAKASRRINRARAA